MPTIPSPLDDLTARQREVLHWIAEGFTTREIADRLGIGTSRVARHATDIFMRLGVRNRVEAAVTYHVWATG
jgi:DNA-binding CsgD family transcriptional regulator